MFGNKANVQWLCGSHVGSTRLCFVDFANVAYHNTLVYLVISVYMEHANHSVIKETLVLNKQ